ERGTAWAPSQRTHGEQAMWVLRKHLAVENAVAARCDVRPLVRAGADAELADLLYYYAVLYREPGRYSRTFNRLVREEFGLDPRQVRRRIEKWLRYARRRLAGNYEPLYCYTGHNRYKATRPDLWPLLFARAGEPRPSPVWPRPLENLRPTRYELASRPCNWMKAEVASLEDQRMNDTAAKYFDVETCARLLGVDRKR